MSFPLSPLERVARARADLRMGVPVVLHGSDKTYVALSAELATADRLAELVAFGPVQLAITRWRAETLKARAYDGDLARLLLPADADVGWVHAVTDPALDLSHPMKGPFQSARGGAVDLPRAAIRLMKDARLLPAALLVEATPTDHSLTVLSTEDLLAPATFDLNRVSTGRVPLTGAANTRVAVYRPEDGSEEHYAIEIASPPREKPVLVRLHSACFTGDVLGSLKCDCGPQLYSALEQMIDGGVLLYLNQEGRGIGLANKMRAYALQDQGFDTVEANHRLGFEDDERDFRIGARILKDMGVTSIRLLTNNPAKVDRMQDFGIDVTERVPLKAGKRPENAAYLSTKARKSGHLL